MAKKQPKIRKKNRKRIVDPLDADQDNRGKKHLDKKRVDKRPLEPVFNT